MKHTVRFWKTRKEYDKDKNHTFEFINRILAEQYAYYLINKGMVYACDVFETETGNVILELP